VGARPEQQLALNFLSAVHDLWIQYPGNYVVEESIDDLVPALAQMCIKSLATDVRDGISLSDQRGTSIHGQLFDHGRVVRGAATTGALSLRDVVNKIIHGTPALVEVDNRAVLLHFTNNASDGWTNAWFSGTQLLRELARLLYKHRTGQAEAREQEIAKLLQTLGRQRFLPTPRAIAGDGS
jgi:hypothetical protein